jgi:CheY-like chemotaxis protein
MAAPLLRLGLTPRETEEIVSQIERSAKRGAQVVKQLLTLGRGSGGQRGIVQTKHLIREMVQIIQETFPKTVSVEQSLARDLWTVSGDVTELHQVLLNLCINARDAMPDGGTLVLKAENVADLPWSKNPAAKPGPYVLIQVSDTGTGIPPGLLDKVFDPFFTTKEPGQGTGLGLTTALGIVQGHRGFIEVENLPAGGTRFQVYLPATPHITAVQTTEDFEELPTGQGQVILVADDEPAFREAVCRILAKAAYQVVTAADGAEAVAAFSKHQDKIKAVLCDLIMPVLDGVGAIRILKKINPRIPVIASSGLGEGAARGEQNAELQRLGVNIFLTKPYERRELLIALQRALCENQTAALGQF